MKIFHAYDIRGKYPEEINEKIAYEIGKAIGTFFKKSVCVGHDTRKGSKNVKSSLIKGLRDSGVDVYSLGLCTTPMISYYSLKNQVVGVQITASHNPPNYTGFKFWNDGIASQKVLEIEKVFNSKNFSHGKGKIIEVTNFHKSYVDFLTKGISSDKRVVVDTFGGVTTKFVNEILRKIGCDVIPLYNDTYEDFDGRIPEPKEGNINKLQELVIKERADFGLALDGDGDRAVFVDENGKIVSAGKMIMIFIKYLLKDRKGKVVVTIDNSPLINNIENAEVMWSRVGYTFIEELAHKHKAIFSGEGSSHFAFGDYYYSSDGILAAIVLTQVLKDKKLSELVEELPHTHTIKTNFSFENHEEKSRIMKKIKQELINKHETSTLDGVKVYLEDSWFLIRPSNTEPKIRLMIEANNKEKCKEILDYVKKLIEKNK
ncbi:MAG: hypothetical protein ACE5J4_02450 [Candidatus Aenigmatarchaeota archaeon]